MLLFLVVLHHQDEYANCKETVTTITRGTPLIKLPLQYPARIDPSFSTSTICLLEGNISDLKILFDVNGHHTRPTFKDENKKVGKEWTEKGRNV